MTKPWIEENTPQYFAFNLDRCRQWPDASGKHYVLCAADPDVLGILRPAIGGHALTHEIRDSFDRYHGHAFLVHVEKTPMSSVAAVLKHNSLRTVRSKSSGLYAVVPPGARDSVAELLNLLEPQPERVEQLQLELATA